LNRSTGISTGTVLSKLIWANETGMFSVLNNGNEVHILNAVASVLTTFGFR